MGDATVTLPFEGDLEFGRMGLTETQIQSALYSSWTGLVVSRERVLNTPGGLRAYLRTYLSAREWGDTRTLASLFTDAELAHFRSWGATSVDVTEPLDAASFGPGRNAVVAIAALTSPTDPLLPQPAPPEILADPVLDPATGLLAVDVLTVVAASRRRHHVHVRHRLAPALSAATPADEPDGKVRP